MSIPKQITREVSAIQSKQRVWIRCVGNSNVEAQWDELERCNGADKTFPGQDTRQEDTKVDGEEVGLDG